MAATDQRVKQSRRERRTPERQQERDRRGRLGKELAQLQDVPPLPQDEPISPQPGPLFKRAMEPAVQESMGPMKYKLFLILCAYADAGQQSPQMRALAARMSTTVPNVMWLLRELQMNKRRLKIKWSKVNGKPNRYTILWHDGE
jgi:hypothetical protein